MPHAEARFFRTVFTGLTGFARCRQQRKPQTTRAVYQKAGRGGTPRRPPARNPRDRLEPVREPVRPDIATALRENPQHPVRDMAARVQARGGLAHRQAGEPLDLPRVRHGQGKGLHKRGQGLHGRLDEACGGMAAILFRHAVLGLRNSPYDARMMVKEAMPDRDETYYTGAYASYEKGAVENCNRLVRRWYPKGTDFNRLTRRQIRQLEDWINSIHRERHVPPFEPGPPPDRPGCGRLRHGGSSKGKGRI